MNAAATHIHFSSLTNCRPITFDEKSKMATDESFDSGTVVLGPSFAGEGQSIIRSGPALSFDGHSSSAKGSLKMKSIVWLMALSGVAIPFQVAAQSSEPEQILSGDSPAHSSPQTTVDRPVSWKLLFPNLLNDQKRIWFFPAQLGHERNWLPSAAVVGTVAGLIALDPTEGSYFRQSSTFKGFNNIFSGNATVIGTVVAPVSLYAIGLIRKDSKMQRIALFAGEAVVDSEILTTVLKDATRRLRPADLQAGRSYSDSWFESGGSLLGGRGSFPSGHTIASFSVATVVARRYGNHRWVPYAAYGMAALVGFSRLSLSAHFLSDAFIGGALGYSVSRFAVLEK